MALIYCWMSLQTSIFSCFEPAILAASIFFMSLRNFCFSSAHETVYSCLFRNATMSIKALFDSIAFLYLTLNLSFFWAATCGLWPRACRSYNPWPSSPSRPLVPFLHLAIVINVGGNHESPCRPVIRHHPNCSVPALSFFNARLKCKRAISRLPETATLLLFLSLE